MACSYQIPVLDNKLIITSFVGTKKEIFHIMNFFKSIAVLFTKCKGPKKGIFKKPSKALSI